MSEAQRRDAIIGTVTRYFEVLDRLDLHSTVACFAEDATLECMTDRRQAAGTAEIREMMTPIIEGSLGMSHAVNVFVVDAEANRCATQLEYKDERADGRRYHEQTCNIFEFDTELRFSAVRFWRGWAHG